MGGSVEDFLWKRDLDKSIYFFLEANFTHLFADTQCRSFDLCPTYNACLCECPPLNGFGTRYILTKEFDATGTYIQNTIPLINRTTLPAKISVDIQMDLAIMFAFNMGNWSVDIGYDGWVRSSERIELLGCIPFNSLGLKGIQNVALQMGGPSNITQSKATLHGNSFTEQAFVADVNPPVFTNTAQIDVNSGSSSRMLTHKIFAHAQYNWTRMTRFLLQPFFGIGLEVEFEGNRPKNLQPNKNGLSQYGVWLKTGIGY